jgi:hypothetical protein
MPKTHVAYTYPRGKDRFARRFGLYPSRELIPIQEILYKSGKP